VDLGHLGPGHPLPFIVTMGDLYGLRPIEISLNGHTFSSQKPELPFVPGRLNVLKLEPDWSQLAEEQIEAIVRKISPDGKIAEYRHILKSGDGREFVLGPLTAPPIYEFEAGVVYRRGYRLDICVKDLTAGRTLYRVAFYQGLSAELATWRQGDQIPAGPERFVAGAKEQVVYNPLYGVESALALKLSDEVLSHQDAVTALCRLNPGACVDRLSCRLEVAGPDGELFVGRMVELGPPDEWVSSRIDVSGWPPGNYRVRLYPIVGGRAWEEGPCVIYRRREHDPEVVPVSRFCPWKLRRDPDQFDAILGGQAELGIKTICWSVGRSWVEYHSELPGVTKFPCVPLEEAAGRNPKALFHHNRATMIVGVHILPWLAMNRHYGVERCGGIFASKFFREHPEWWQWRKNADSPRGSEVCYFFLEVRRERAEILLEVARRGADGLLIGCCRQVPMLLYNPQMKDRRRSHDVRPYVDLGRRYGVPVVGGIVLHGPTVPRRS